MKNKTDKAKYDRKEHERYGRYDMHHARHMSLTGDSDQLERKAKPWIRYRSAYSVMVGDAPVCAPGDHDAARRHLKKLEAARDRGMWSHNEWNRLYDLIKKWRGRAEGKSEYFEKYGTQRMPESARTIRRREREAQGSQNGRTTAEEQEIERRRRWWEPGGGIK